MIKEMSTASTETILRVADLMLTAAKTAPKASGQDKVIGCCLTGEEKRELSDAMMKLGTKLDEEFIKRDSKNVDNCEAIVMLGTLSTPFGLDNCHFCGFKNCGEMAKMGGHCAVNITDLGIAIGSAVSIAADNRIDNRVMYSAGRAAVAYGLMPEGVKIAYGIPLYVGSKSIFFDRGPGAILR